MKARVRAQRRSAHLLALAMVVAGCGGGGGGGGSTAPAPSVAGGNVVKGIIDHASVSVFALANGAKGSLITSATTDSLGHYSVTIPGENSGPFYLEATTGGTSRMRCDVQAGCGTNSGSDDKNSNGQADFGEFFPAPALTLSAIAPDVATLDGLSITPLTHLAARHAFTAPQGGDGTSGKAANSQLGNLLGLNASITAQGSFDITNPPTTATLAQWHYSLLAAAMAAVGSDALGTRLDHFADTYAGNGGQVALKTSQAGELGVQAWLTAAKALADQLHPEAATLFSQQLAALASASDGQLSQAAPDAGIGTSANAPVATFLGQWRSLRSQFPLPGDGAPWAAENTAQFDPDVQAQFALARAIGQFGKFAPQISKLDLLKDYACSQSPSPFLCNTLFKQHTTRVIFCTDLNLDINGETLCQLGEHMPFSVPAGLTATANIYDTPDDTRASHMTGTLGGYTLDLTLTPATPGDTQLPMSISGAMAKGGETWTVNSGSVTYQYDATIDASNVLTPQTMTVNLTLARSGTHASQTSVTLTANMADVAGHTTDILHTALTGLTSLDYQATGTGTGNGRVSTTLKGGASGLLVHEEPIVPAGFGFATQVLLSGTPAQWISGDQAATATWSEGRLAETRSGGVHTLSGNNDIRAVLPESEGKGSIYIGTHKVARLILDNGQWRVQLQDFSEEAL